MVAEGLHRLEGIQQATGSHSIHKGEVSDPVATAPQATVDSKPLPSNNSKSRKAKGNALFAAYLALFACCMVAAFHGMIPEFEWEKQSLKFHADWMYLMHDHHSIPVACAVAYVVLTFGVQHYLRDRKGWDKTLRLPLAWWSIFLAAFSFLGALRTVPVVFEILRENKLRHLMCGDTRSEWLAYKASGVWTLLFCLSKIPELLDTAFIVLRKKPLITLHWYHHITVMLFCWHAWGTMALNGIVFAAMNLTVHAVMYAFYALTALGMRPEKFAMSITLGQILQMVVGSTVTVYVAMDKLSWHPVERSFDFKAPTWVAEDFSIPDGDECFMSNTAAASGLLMYFSYLYFFVEFFYVVYCTRGSKVKAE